MNITQKNRDNFNTLKNITDIAEELKDFVYAIETGCDKETPIETYKDKAKQHLLLLKKKVEELHNIE